MKIFTIASLSLRRLLRDKTALFFTLLFPMLIIFVVGLAIFGGTTGAAADKAKVGVISTNSGALGSELVGLLTSADRLEIHHYRDLTALRKDLRRETIDAGLVIPSGYDAALRAGLAAQIQFLAPVIDPAPAVRAIVGNIVVRQGGEVKAAAFASSFAGGEFERNLETARQVQGNSQQPQVGVEKEVVGRELEQTVPVGYRYPAASNLILFVFITSVAGASQLVESRRLGVSRRMLGTPTSARTILAGEAFGRFVIAAFQGLFIFVVGILIFRVAWGNSFGAAALILTFSLVGTSIGMMAGTLFRTPEQAGAIGPPLGIALGMLGGCMWPLEIVPAAMRTIGHVTPHAWAMDAWVDLIGRGLGIDAILPELAVLGGFVVLLLPLAALRLRKSLYG